jgi:hypothetical protein
MYAKLPLDMYGRTGKAFEYEFIDIDTTLPKQVKTLIQKYPYLFFLPDTETSSPGQRKNLNENLLHLRNIPFHL